jgi:site-specific recombinase XerD
LNEEFHEHLLTKFKRNTARKHTMIVDLFIEFLCRHTDVERVEDITRGMANTYFKTWWKNKVWDSTTPEQIRVALKKFFTFLAKEKGMVNEKVMNSFK